MKENIKITDLNLSLRTKNVLIKANITTLKELASLNLDSLMRVNGLGRKGLTEITELLKSYGYKTFEQEDEQVTLEELLSNKECESIKTCNLPLSVRVSNCLIRANITTLKELASLDLDSLMRVKNLGRTGLDEVLQLLNSCGYEYIGDIKINYLLHMEDRRTLNEVLDEKEPNNIYIKDLPIKNDLRNLLLRKNIKTLEDLLSYDVESLLELKSIGYQRLEEILSMVHILGYTLKGEKTNNTDKNKTLNLKNE